MFFEKQQIDKPYKEIFRDLFYEITPQSNSHGSPYIFDKFDDNKFFTGEGAAAHGRGHYSADLFKTADKYRRPTGYANGKWFILDNVDIPEQWVGWSNEKKTSYLDYLIKRYQKALSDPTLDKGYREDWGHILDNLEDFKKDGMKYNTGKVYEVNVPNPNQMLWEDLYTYEQPKYIQEKLSPYRKETLDYLGKTGRDVLRDIGEDRLEELGIKGVRAIGKQDGPINVTFSQDNIKMANSPWQKFVNRIPKKALGELANKIITSPALRTYIDMAPNFLVGDKYIKPLDIIMSKGKEKQQKLQKMFEDAGYEVKIQPDGTYLFRI